MIFLQATGSRGPAFQLLRLVEAKTIELLVCPEIIAELRDVLQRPKVQRQFPVLTAEFVETYVARIEQVSTMVSSVPRLVRLDRDPDDEIYLNLAIASKADVLVTRDDDLLSFRAGSAPRILDPAALLRELRRTDQP